MTPGQAKLIRDLMAQLNWTVTDLRRESDGQFQEIGGLEFEEASDLIEFLLERGRGR